MTIEFIPQQVDYTAEYLVGTGKLGICSVDEVKRIIHKYLEDIKQGILNNEISEVYYVLTMGIIILAWKYYDEWFIDVVPNQSFANKDWNYTEL